MSFKYTGDSGMIPNIGTFNAGDEVSDETAKLLKDAGYSVSETKKPAKTIIEGEA